MCGFAGFIDRSSSGVGRPDEVLAAQLATLVHRGPDDEGMWSEPDRGVFLGFRRLSIQDLSPLGHQPMLSASERFVITFNGEIYNFQTLREELRELGFSFRGGSDTEVLLAAIEQWGPEGAVPRLRGMFAIALWDRQEKALWLARDRMGIKPLYLADSPRGIVFGSELRALLDHPFVERTGNPAAAWHFLRTLYVPGPLAMLAGVEKVRPGTLVRFDTSDGHTLRRTEARYWDLAEIADREHSFGRTPDEVVGELHHLLGEAVKLRMVADVPVGALLSGGVDSSLVVALMAEHSSRPVRTFTIRFDDPRFDEGPVAAAVAEQLGAEHTEVAMPTDAVKELVPDLPSYSDEPMANPSILPTLLVCRAARRDVTVALSGDGGDELFGGYNRYTQTPNVLRATRWVPHALRPGLARALRGAADVPGIDTVGRLVAPDGLGSQHAFGERLARVAGAVGAGDAAATYAELMAVGLRQPALVEAQATPVFRGGAFASHPGSLLGRMMLSDQLEYLPDDLLAKVDRASMRTSLEVRVPILDHEVVEWSWGLPDDLKIRDGVPKWPLRALAERFLPAEILDRPKMGFTVPIRSWLETGLAPWLAEAVAPERVRARGILDPRQVTRLHKEFLAGRPGRSLGLWAVAVLEYWCEANRVGF